MGHLSGKFVIRMPGDLHGRLRDEAARSGQSLNQLCVAKLQASVQSSSGEALPHAELISADSTAEIVQQFHEELIGLVLFGSTARGDATGDSDIDLLLVLETGTRIVRDLYRKWDDCFPKARDAQDSDRISPHFVSLPGRFQDAGGLWYETSIDGLILWEIDRRVSRFLSTVREAMGRGEIRRRMVHGSPYWIKEGRESNAQ